MEDASWSDIATIESSPKQSSKCGQTTVNTSANLQSTLTSQCWSKLRSNRGQHWLIWTTTCKVEAPHNNPQSKVSLHWSTQSSSTSVNPSQHYCTFLRPPAPKSMLLLLHASSCTQVNIATPSCILLHPSQRCCSFLCPPFCVLLLPREREMLLLRIPKQARREKRCGDEMSVIMPQGLLYLYATLRFSCGCKTLFCLLPDLGKLSWYK